MDQLRSYGVRVNAKKGFNKQGDLSVIYQVTHFKDVPVKDDNHFLMTHQECKAIAKSEVMAKEYALLMTGHIATQVQGIGDGFAESLQHIDPYA